MHPVCPRYPKEGYVDEQVQQHESVWVGLLQGCLGFVRCASYISYSLGFFVGVDTVRFCISEAANFAEEPCQEDSLGYGTVLMWFWECSFTTRQGKEGGFLTSQILQA